MLHFKLDENLPIDTTQPLRDAGHDVATAIDQDLGGRPDDQIIQVCKNENRAFITLDLDFSDIRTYPPAEFSGIIILRLARQDKLHIVDVIRRLLPALENEPLSGKLWIVGATSVRVRD